MVQRDLRRSLADLRPLASDKELNSFSRAHHLRQGPARVTICATRSMPPRSGTELGWEPTETFATEGMRKTIAVVPAKTSPSAIEQVTSAASTSGSGSRRTTTDRRRRAAIGQEHRRLAMAACTDVSMKGIILAGASSGTRLASPHAHRRQQAADAHLRQADDLLPPGPR